MQAGDAAHDGFAVDVRVASFIAATRPAPKSAGRVPLIGP